MLGTPQKRAFDHFFEIRLTSIAPEIPLPFDIYLAVNQKPVLFRKKGDQLTAARIQRLLANKRQHFLIPLDQRHCYLGALRDVIQNPDTPREQKASFIKESAFIHLHDLFTHKDIAHVVSEATVLIEEMVAFVSTDVHAVSSLMRLSSHDYYTYNHCVDVAIYSIALGKKILGNDKRSLMLVGLGGFLHDIGKRRIDWKIINKPGPLTDAEWVEIRKHPNYGVEILSELDCIPNISVRVVHEHHENFDGSGYPRGIEGEEISKLSRIVSIADVFDALTTDRSYQKSVSPSDALKIMSTLQPGKFDPALFKSFDKKFHRKGLYTFAKDFDPCQPQSLLKLVRR